MASSCLSSMHSSIINSINSRNIVSFNHHHQIFISSSSFSIYNNHHQKYSFSRPPVVLIKAETAIDDHKIDHGVERRTANYKPNIWKYDLLLQSLNSQFSEKKYKMRVQTLKEEVASMFMEANNPLYKLKLVDSISKLGLDKYFEEEIKQVLDTMGSKENNSSGLELEDDLYSTALRFRLLRNYGHNASQDMFMGLVDESGKLTKNQDTNLKDLLELFEASNMAREGENILNEAKLFSIQSLSCFEAISDQILQAMRLPLQWRVEWYNVKRHINAHEKEQNINIKLLELSKLNFNLVQASHQQDLKEVSRWWMNLGTKEKLSFCRDRLVESFLYAAGVASEAQHGSLRKWLTKVIKLILIVDDVYDIYGSLEELECFTNAVGRWRPEEVKDLPECIKICFWTLFNTTEEIAVEIQQEKGWTSVLPYLHNAWADFCKSLLLEAKWYNKGSTPSLEEYLDNGWISSSGPLLALLAILGVADGMTRDVEEYLKDCRDITYHASLIIRLCNDQGTSAAELARGDAASSILCYMREANVSEEIARDHIRSMIMKTWQKINGHCINTSPFLQEPFKYIINTARVAHYTYQHGDGFGVQDGETRDRVLSNFIEPLHIEENVAFGRNS